MRILLNLGLNKNRSPGISTLQTPYIAVCFFEREIRTIRNVLSGLMNEQPIKLRDEELSTLMCEVESLLNNRPLTEVSRDLNDDQLLTPNHLLLLNAGATFPPGLFNKDDGYARRR